MQKQIPLSLFPDFRSLLCLQKWDLKQCAKMPNQQAHQNSTVLDNFLLDQAEPYKHFTFGYQYLPAFLASISLIIFSPLIERNHLGPSLLAPGTAVKSEGNNRAGKGIWEGEKNPPSPFFNWSNWKMEGKAALSYSTFPASKRRKWPRLNESTKSPGGLFRI